MSVLHRDRDRIMTTHYCGHGNQPRLVPTAGRDDDLVLECLDATTLADPDVSRVVGLRLAIEGGGGLHRIETYRPAGSEQTSRLHLQCVDVQGPASDHGS
jgi:hypothetical protein